MNRHQRRGQEHANWGWSLQVLAIVGVVGMAVYVVGLLVGWW